MSVVRAPRRISRSTSIRWIQSTLPERCAHRVPTMFSRYKIASRYQDRLRTGVRERWVSLLFSHKESIACRERLRLAASRHGTHAHAGSITSSAASASLASYYKYHRLATTNSRTQLCHESTVTPFAVVQMNGIKQGSAAASARFARPEARRGGHG